MFVCLFVCFRDAKLEREAEIILKKIKNLRERFMFAVYCNRVFLFMFRGTGWTMHGGVRDCAEHCGGGVRDAGGVAGI